MGLCLLYFLIQTENFTCAIKMTSSSRDLFSLSGDRRKISRILKKWRYCCRNSSLYDSGSRLIRFWSCGKLSGNWLLCRILYAKADSRESPSYFGLSKFCDFSVLGAGYGYERENKSPLGDVLDNIAWSVSFFQQQQQDKAATKTRGRTTICTWKIEIKTDNMMTGEESSLYLANNRYTGWSWY